jgi:hypothetical protein
LNNFQFGTYNTRFRVRLRLATMEILCNLQEKRKLQTCYNYYSAVFSPSFSVFRLNSIPRKSLYFEKMALALAFL